MKFFGLCGFAAFLSPAFLRIAWFYYTDRRVKRNLQYGSAPRNRLDLYLPPGCAFDTEKTEAAVRAADAETDAGRDPAPRERHENGGSGGGRPVIVFVTGGMWIIGYKAWGALLAQSLMKQGFIVASLDYRNFPQGTVGEMIQDVGCGIGWVVKRAVALGGDPRRIVVVGQSAGAHLSATAILRQAEWELSGYGLASAWSPSSLAGFVGVSGVYSPDDQSLVDHFHRRGLHREVFHSIMEAGYSGARAEEALPRASPCAILRDQAGVPGLISRQPPVLLCHGSADTSAPPSESAKFATALRVAGVAEVTEKYYPGKTHTDPFVTDPILGGHDALLEDIVAFVRKGERALKLPALPRLLPKLLVDIARTMVPF